MTLGLKRGVVELADHDPEWEMIAAQTIDRLWRVFGSVAKDIQHIGSTSILGIKAKPIIDIVVSVDDFKKIELLIPELERNGFDYRGWFIVDRIMVLNAYNKIGHTHHVHVVKTDSGEWNDHINFRDYLNANPRIAKEYEDIKVRLASDNPVDPGREKYLAGKHDFIVSKINEARIWTEFGRKFTKIEPIIKGWSDDKKYYIETADGRHMLLRVSDIAELDCKKAEYEMMERVYGLGVLTSEPLGFGLCNGDKNCYSLSGWLDGEDAREALPFLSETEQYVLGMKAGETLRKIHTLPAPDNAELWSDRFYRKVQSRIDFYNENPVKSESCNIIISYLQENRHLLDGRPQTFNHGDFNISNMMIMPDKQIGVIDFNSYNKDHGDPWWEFDPCMDGWGSEPSAHFHTGLIKGYFNGEPPGEFFDVFSYYLAYDALAALCDTSIHNQGEPEVGKLHMENILRWFDNMNNPIPTWYLKDFYIQWIDDIPYKLETSFDFSFLRKYGKVFKVFDEQGSGNISFGIENADKKYFVKFAGAPKPNYISNRDSGAVDAASAIKLLKAAVPLYTELAHSTLIKFVFAEEIGGGYAAVFKWEGAIGIEPKDSPDYMRFMQMPVEKKMKAFEDIVEFHTHVAAKGYVALDFYDGSILYDYKKEKVIICDIDLYQKSPYINAEGLGIVGSARYVSPEECVKDAIMDEITNVYTMGATAFALFAYGDRAPEAWTLSPESYVVVKKAVSDNRGERQQSIVQLIEEWRAAR